MITIIDLADDILGMIEDKTIDIYRHITHDLGDGKWYMEHFISFEDVLDNIDNIDTDYIEDSQEEDESLTRCIFNHLYWDEQLTHSSWEKEHERVYGKDII